MIYRDYNDDIQSAEFADLKGKTLKSIEMESHRETVTFTTTDGEIYKQTYYQDCCASCSVEEIHGDLKDLIGTPILMAEEVRSRKPDEKLQQERDQARATAAKLDEFWYSEPESETWVFYKLSTIKGSVTIRWYGASNGYYSESPDFEKFAS